MYFEEIYNLIRPLWKDSFLLENIEKTDSYIKDIKKNYNEIEYIVDFSNRKMYSEWESMLIFTMYQTLTAFALEKWSNEKATILYLDEIPITLFEEYFR